MINIFNRKSSLLKSRNQLEISRAQIRNLVHVTSTNEIGDPILQSFTDQDFEDVAHTKNVKAVLCKLGSCADIDDSLTIMNCIMGEDSYIEPHMHESYERIFVIAGSVENTISGEVFSEGAVISIKPKVLHAFKSDYALLTLTWRPAFKQESFCY